MTGNPSWLSAQDAVADEAAWQQVRADPGQRSADVVCRAIRHHNWRQAPGPVQACTCSKDASDGRDPSINWQGTTVYKLLAARQFVNHAPVKWSSDAATKRQLLAYLRGARTAMPADFLVKVAREFHEYKLRASRSAPRPLWLADEEALAQRSPFNSADILDRVCILGLFHFLPITPDPVDAVLLMVYQLDSGQTLHQPDWRHGYDSFYFAAQPNGQGHGMTRDLRDGSVGVHEWVVPPESVDANRQLVDADIGCVKSAMGGSDLSAQYWQGLGDDVAGAL